MLSNKFVMTVVVGLVVVMGLAIFPAFNTAFRTVGTNGMTTEMIGIKSLFPYFLIFVVFYAGYMVYKRGK